MALEDEIKTLTAAVNKLTAALDGQGSLPLAGKPAKGKPAKAAEPEDDEGVIDEEVEAPKKAVGKAAAKPAAKPAPKKKAAGLTYDDIRQPGLDFSRTHGRDEILAILQEFEAENGQGVAEDQRQAYLDRLAERDAELSEGVA